MTILIDADGCPGGSVVMKNKTSCRTLPLIRLNLRLWRRWWAFSRELSNSNGLRLLIFPQPLGRALKNQNAAPTTPPCFCHRQRSSSLHWADCLRPAGRRPVLIRTIFAAKKARHTAICRQKPAAFFEMTLEKAFFTRGVNGCISGVVVLDVR